jgi:hypothetical protein
MHSSARAWGTPCNMRFRKLTGQYLIYANQGTCIFNNSMQCGGLTLKTCFDEHISKVMCSSIKLQLLSSEGLNNYDRGIIEVVS